MHYHRHLTLWSQKSFLRNKIPYFPLRSFRNQFKRKSCGGELGNQSSTKTILSTKTDIKLKKYVKRKSHKHACKDQGTRQVFFTQRKQIDRYVCVIHVRKREAIIPSQQFVLIHKCNITMIRTFLINNFIQNLIGDWLLHRFYVSTYKVRINLVMM